MKHEQFVQYCGEESGSDSTIHSEAYQKNHNQTNVLLLRTQLKL